MLMGVPGEGSLISARGGQGPLRPSVSKLTSMSQALWTPAGGYCQGVQRARQTLGWDCGRVRRACRS